MDLLRSGLVFLFLLHSIESKDCVIDNRPKIAAWEDQLRTDLHICGNSYEPPDANNTKVVMRFILKSFYFDRTEQVLSMSTWLMLFWNDSRLSWNPESYDGITEALVSVTYIWTPSLRLYSASDVDNMDIKYFYEPLCRVNNSGHVSCTSRVLHQTVCISKLSDWPYDIQNCSFTFGPKSERDRTTYTLQSSHVVSFGAEYGPGWNIIEHTVNKDPKSTVQLSINFVLERQGEGLAASVVVPPLVLSAITISSLLLEVDGGNRFGLLCFSLLNQFFFLQVISSEIPSNRADAPTVLFYLRSLLIWTLLAIGISYVLRYLKRKSTPPSRVIEISINKIFNSYGKYLIWPRWDTSIDDDKGNKDIVKYTSLWTDLASVINFLFMLTIVIVATIHYFAYIPQQQVY